MIPIAVIWFGIGEMSKYFLIFWGTFFIVLINTTAGVWRAPIARQRAAECLGANQLQIFVLVVIPSAAPYIVTGMRVAMASSFMSIIPAEILAADSGIGYLLQKSSMLLQTNRIFVALLTICILGFVFDRVFRFLVDRMLSRYMSYVARDLNEYEAHGEPDVQRFEAMRRDCFSACIGGAPTQAQQAPLKMTLFGQPSVNNDAIWMAFEKGFYQEEGLDVTYRLFPSGTTAFQTFQTGQGDIVMTGDLPSVQYFFRVKGDYRTIAAIERDAKGYVAVARKDITKPQDLVGKTIATRVGSTGSWFISEYLTKNGVDPTKVTVKNLDTQVLPAALCGGDIAAFFIWQPIGSRTLEICAGQGALPVRRHRLHPGLPGRRRAPGMARHRRKARTSPRAGCAPPSRAATSPRKTSPAVAAYAKAKLDLSEKATRDQWDTNTRPLAIDKVYYDDFCSLSRWAQTEKMTEQKIDFNQLTWPDGLKAINPKLVDAPPPPC